MTLPFPYIFYGTVSDSNGLLVNNAIVYATGDSTTSDNTDSLGKYTINLQDYASSGGTITVSIDYDGEKEIDSWKLDIHLPGKNVNYTLKEAYSKHDIYINTNKHYDDEVYIHTPNDINGWMKTSDY